MDNVNSETIQLKCDSPPLKRSRIETRFENTSHGSFTPDHVTPSVVIRKSNISKNISPDFPAKVQAKDGNLDTNTAKGNSLKAANISTSKEPSQIQSLQDICLAEQQHCSQQCMQMEISVDREPNEAEILTSGDNEELNVSEHEAKDDKLSPIMLPNDANSTGSNEFTSTKLHVIEECKKTGHLQITAEVLNHRSMLENLQATSTCIIHTLTIHKLCKLEKVLNIFKLPASLKILRIKNHYVDDNDVIQITNSFFHIKALEELDLTETKFLNNSRFILLSALVNLPALKQLILQKVGIEKRDVRFLTAVLPFLKDLKILNLSENDLFTDDVDTLLNSFSNIEKLRVIDFSSNPISWNIVLYECLSRLPFIEKLDVADSFTESNCNTIQPNLSHSAIKELRLSSNKMGKEAFSLFCPLLSYCNNLEKLYLDENFIGDSIWALCSGIRPLRGLKTLSLNCNNLGDESTHGVRFLLSNTPLLEELSLAQNKFSFNDFQELEPFLSKLKNLRVLNISDNPSGVAISDVLQRVLRCLGLLEELNLKSIKLDGSGLKKISLEIASLKRLKCLNLSSNLISSGGGEALADVLPSLEVLENLNLCRTGMCEQDMMMVCEKVRTAKHLKILDLSCNQIGYGNVEILGNSLSCLSLLEELHIGNTGLGPHTTKSLFEKSGPLRNLKKLYFGLNNLRGEGSVALASILPAMEQLEELDLHGCVLDNDSCQLIYRSIRSLIYLTKLKIDRLSGVDVVSNGLTECLPSLLSIEDLDTCQLMADNDNNVLPLPGSLRFLKHLYLDNILIHSFEQANTLAKTISSFTKLEELSLCTTDSTDLVCEPILASMGSLNSLWHFSLDCRHDATMPSVIKLLPSLLNLSQLALNFADLGDNAQDLFPLLKFLKYLNVLDLCNSSLGIDSLIKFTEVLPSLSHLEILLLPLLERDHFNSVVCDERRLKNFFAAMASLNYLKVLSFNDSWLNSGPVIEAFAISLHSLYLLEELEFYVFVEDKYENVFNSNNIAKFVTAVASLKYLNKLHFITERVVTPFLIDALGGRLTSFKKLEEFSLCRKWENVSDVLEIDKESIRKFFIGAASLRYLKRIGLTLSFNYVEELARALPCLQCLKVFELVLLDSEKKNIRQLFRAIGSLVNLKQLCIFKDSKTVLNSSDLTDLFKVLPSLPLLKKIEIDFNSRVVDDESIELMASLQFLKTFSLSGVVLSTDAAKRLVKTLGTLHQLEELKLKKLALSKRVTKDLCEVVGSLPFLKLIDIDGEKLDSDCVVVLVRTLPSLKQLQNFVCHGLNVTIHEKESLMSCVSLQI